MLWNISAVFDPFSHGHIYTHGSVNNIGILKNSFKNPSVQICILCDSKADSF